MKKVICLVTKDDVGGAQKYVQDLSESLNRAEFETKIITGGKGGAKFLSNKFWPHLLFINDWLALAELFFLFRREKPDIVHLNSSKAGVIGAIAAKLAGASRVVFTAHGWVFNPNNDLSFLRRKLYIWFHRLAAVFQDAIINVSEYDRQLAARHKIAPLNKLVTIHNGLDSKNMKFLDKTTARKTLAKLISNPQLPISNSTWVGSIGRLVNEKSYEDFIDAAALIKNPETRFFIIGSGEKKRYLQSLIAKRQMQNRFFIIEGLAPAAIYLKAFDVFVLSSIKEGLPYTMLEAMAAELPIVTTRVGGMTEIIAPADGEKRGLAMPPREPEELARAIDYLLKNPQEATGLAREAKRFLKENLALEKMARETEQIYLTA